MAGIPAVVQGKETEPPGMYSRVSYSAMFLVPPLRCTQQPFLPVIRVMATAVLAGGYVTTAGGVCLLDSWELPLVLEALVMNPYVFGASLFTGVVN